MSGGVKANYIGTADASLTSYLKLAGSMKDFPRLPTISSKNTTPILGTYFMYYIHFIYLLYLFN